MNKKIYIITILAIIVTTLSQTVSFISGEHQFYQSVQDKCIKCHGDIKNQLLASTNHSSSPCNYCHVKSTTDHTNTKPACQDCHNTTLKLSDSLEAHTDFSSMSSKGCIACHTTYNALVNYSRAEYIDYTITNNRGNWVISNITTIGTLNLSYNAQRTGGDHDLQNVSCKDCHEDIFSAVVAGGHAVVLDKNGTQAAYHNNSNSTLEAWCRTCHSRNDANFSTQQHSVRRTNCEECHQAYNSAPHPGNFFANINTVPHLYRSLVCISCHSIGWPAPGGGIHFKVHQEPYFDVTYEIIEPLLITNSTPASDPTTTVGTAQAFSITLNRPADIYWYNDGSEIFRALSVISSSYTSSSSTVGVYNITAIADDGSATVSKTWNWTVTNQTGNGTGGGGGGGVPVGGIITGSATGPSGSNNISGYVFDNNVLALPGVQVQDGSYQNITNISGFYSMTNLPNGTYTFSYSKAGFDTGYSIFTLNGASVENVNVIIYDTTPPASVSNISTAGGNFYINNTWVNPTDADFNYTWFRYDNGTALQNINSSTDYLNLTWSPHYIQNISAQTVDTYNNINPAQVWFNATVPNNAPVQIQVGNKTVDEGLPLNFTVSSTDADNDTITYGTNATKGNFNSTTGNFLWIPGYGDAGIYNWYFNSSDNYGGISTENIAVTVSNVPLSITNSSPVSDPTTIIGSSQTFSITLNRTADIIWYNNGSEAFRVLNVTAATYINSTAGVGTYNITAFANDSYDSVSRSWNWSVAPNINGTNVSGGADGGGGSGGSNNSVSGYVSDNSGLSLGGVLVQNGSYQNTTDVSGYYSIANLSNGTYNFSYSRAGFSNAYFEFTFNGAVVMNANKTLYDVTSAASVSNPAMTTGNFYVNNTWVNPVDADFNYTWFRYSNDTTLQNVSKPVNYLNLTWSPHYIQNISAQTVDTSGNANQTKVWFNTTIPNNAPFQYAIGNKVVNENENLQFNVTATDADNDIITYGTNATKGIFNATTGNFSWTPGYGDAGFYFWNFNSSDGYGGIANENIAVTVISEPLSITGSSPVSDPITIVGTTQAFGITLNRTADVTWYVNNSVVQSNLSVVSANYTNSSAGIGAYNVTVIANDSYYSASRTWNWTVSPQPTYNVSGYVFDNYGSGLGNVLVKNESGQNTTDSSGYYLITGLFNGTYNFNYSKADFNTGYLGVTINGADNTSANITVYDTTPPASISNSSAVTGNFYINNTWMNPADMDLNYIWFRYDNGITLQNISTPANNLNLTWSPHYTQNISAQTVDNYSNVNQTMVWFNATIPNNPPVQAAIGNRTVYEGQWLNFTVSATDADNDTITYGTNATNGTLNTTTGNYSWIPNYGEAGFYFWNFNSSDGYGGIANENVAVTVINAPLSIRGSSPVSDPTTINGTAQTFGITLDRTANITWYINNSVVQSNLSVASANYTNSTAGIGMYNVTAIANDSYDSTSRTWNLTVTEQPAYNVSGYVFDNYGSGLGDVLVQNSSYQNTTLASGYYQITGLFNGTYNFSYSKAGFNTGYLDVTINGADNTTANKTIYDTTPSASVSNPGTTTGNFHINNTWVNPVDADFNYTWFRYSNGTDLQNVSSPVSYLNLTWQPHYTQNISAQTVDAYGNINQTEVWFNATIPNNAPFQYSIGNKMVNENENLQFNVTATDADSDLITYGTNATKGTLDAATGNFSWTPAYGDTGVYLWYFNSSDGFGGISTENIAVTVNNVPLSIMNSSPAGDPTTTVGTDQAFGITLNRTADVSWYINGSIVQTNSSAVSADYINSTAGIGEYNVTAIANNSYYSVSKTWNWTVTPQPAYNVSGYVSDNYGSGLEGVLVQNGSNQSTTLASGYYSITGLFNGTYIFSYSKPGFNTGYLEVTVSGADKTSANTTIYDTTPPASVSNPAMITGNFYINNTWTNPVDADFNYIWFRYSNGTNLQNISSPVSYLNLTLSPHYTQSISAQTVDTYGNINQTQVWFNTTIPNNPPVQSSIGDKSITAGSLLQFNVTATDADSDQITYGTNAINGTLNSTGGEYSWQTGSSDAGTYVWNFNSSDTYGGVANETIIVTVTVAPPSKYIPPAPVNLTSTQGNFWINNSWEAGAGNATDSYNVSVNGSWINGTTDTYYNDTVGPHGWSNITIWAYNNSDGGSLSSVPVSQSTQVANNAPVQTTIGNKIVNEGDLVAFTVPATDADSDTITYGTNATKGDFNTTTGNFSWMPGYGDSGVYTWYFNSSDDFGGVSRETITVTVNDIPLSITSSSPSSDPATMAGISQIFGIALNRTANMTWYIDGSVVQTDSGTASANYTNSTAEAGIYNVTVAATDGYDSISKQWNWTVSPQPVYAPGIISWSNNKTNNDSLTLAVNTSESVNFNATANQTIISWNWYLDGMNQNNNYDNFTAFWSTAGTKTIQINATNSNGTSNTIAWIITVQAQPEAYVPPPPANMTSTIGNFWINTTWEPGAGNTTDSYNVSTNGIWTNGTTSTYVNSSLSAHSWQNVTVYAYNVSGNGSLSISAATKDTQVPNNPPVLLSIGPKSVEEGQWLNFTVNATDIDNDPMTYGTDATKGNLNAATGSFSWLTTYSDAGIYVWYFNSSDGYGGIANETITVTVNNTPLSVISSLPLSDPTTTQGTMQTFNVTLSRTANVTWYMNGMQVQTDTGTASASYTNSTAGTGTWNVTASATDNIDTVSRTWNWTVIAQPTYNLSGYVFDNYGSGLVGVLVENGSKQDTTISSGYYTITGLLNGTYNFSYSRTGFNTSYLEVTISGADIINANKTLYDTAPPAQVTGLRNDTPTRSTINLSWDPLAEAYYYQVFRNSSSLGYTQSAYWNDTGLTADTLYEYVIRANDSYNNWGQNSSILGIKTAPASDTTPPSAVSSPNTATGNFYINNTWVNPQDTDFNHTWFRYSDGTTLQNISQPTNYLNLTWSPHYIQNISAQTADTSGNVNQTKVWFNATIPDNAPVQSPIGNKSVDEGQWLNFTISSTDADGDSIIYGTNATKGFLNTTTGSFSWLTTYSDSGTYVWYFNSNDGYGGIVTEAITVTVNNTPLSITSFSPPSDPTTTQGIQQSFSIILNRTANVTWYMNGAQVQTDTGTTSASYTNSTAETGTWNVTASATDGINTVSRTWNWTINAQPPTAYVPPDPTNLQNTTSNFWVNHTWLPGTGNTTDSYNVSVNGTWYNMTTNTYYNNMVGPHGWSNITVWAYNSSGTGSLSAGSVSQNTQVPNNPLAQNPIGNKNIIAGDLLTFTVSATDADNDTMTYGTNATKGTLNSTTGVYSWQTGSNDIGTYIWHFNSSDGYGGVAGETITVTVNNMPLSIISSSPVSDPTTTVGAAQAFSISLNRTANVSWYVNGSTVQTNSSVISANYTNSTAGVGAYNITATASDGLESTSRIWNWTVILQPAYNVSGYVSGNNGSGLEGVLVKNDSYQSNTLASGYYLITGLLNGTYNFSYSKAGFNTGYLEITINGADNTTANITIYDTTPPASISNIAAASAPLYINWTWTDPSDADFDHVEAYIDSTFVSNITRGEQFYNASYFIPNSTHTISTRTVDTYGNVNTTWVNNTAASLPDYTYVSSFQNDTGTVSDFTSVLNASDGGASATFTEALVGGTYQLNATTNTTDIPAAVVQTLQLGYNVSSDNFTLQIWNGTTWNNRTTLNDTSPSYRDITLQPEELIPDGAFAGNASSISRYYVLVRYLDLDASAAQQGRLYLDYQRIYSE